MFDYNKVDWKKYGGKTKIDIFSCVFNVDDQSNTFTFHIIAFCCNGTDLNCSADDIFNGPFTVRLDKPLRLAGLKEVTYDEEEATLTLNSEIYHIVNSDFVYFLGDFQGDQRQAYGNLMKHLAQYIQTEYI